VSCHPHIAPNHGLIGQLTTRPSAKLTAHSTALICQDTNLQGEITIGAGCIVHPKASILALGGPIVIGQNCVIEETAAIVNKYAGNVPLSSVSPALTKKDPRGDVYRRGQRLHDKVSYVFAPPRSFLTLGVESPRVGDFNVFHPRSFASSLVHVTDHCNLGAFAIPCQDPLFTSSHPRIGAETTGAGTVALPLDPMGTDTLAPYTVVYGADSSRRVWDGSGETAELDLRQKHTEYLREIMPK
jgi:dynactin-6